jgi:hypothetical protein
MEEKKKTRGKINVYSNEMFLRPNKKLAGIAKGDYFRPL